MRIKGNWAVTMIIHRELFIHEHVGYLCFGSPECRLLGDGVGFRRVDPAPAPVELVFLPKADLLQDDDDA